MGLGFFFVPWCVRGFLRWLFFAAFLPSACSGGCAAPLARLLCGVSAEAWVVQLTISVSLCRYLTTFLPHRISIAPPMHTCITGWNQSPSRPPQMTFRAVAEIQVRKSLPFCMSSQQKSCLGRNFFFEHRQWSGGYRQLPKRHVFRARTIHVTGNS